eukprot:5903530-Amphidinium_carterae.1
MPPTTIISTTTTTTVRHGRAITIPRWAIVCFEHTTNCVTSEKFTHQERHFHIADCHDSVFNEAFLVKFAIDRGLLSHLIKELRAPVRST